jgi:hypothetical protein
VAGSWNWNSSPVCTVLVFASLTRGTLYQVRPWGSRTVCHRTDRPTVGGGTATPVRTGIDHYVVPVSACTTWKLLPNTQCRRTYQWSSWWPASRPYGYRLSRTWPREWTESRSSERMISTRSRGIGTLGWSQPRVRSGVTTPHRHSALSGGWTPQPRRLTLTMIPWRSWYSSCQRLHSTSASDCLIRNQLEHLSLATETTCL